MPLTVKKDKKKGLPKRIQMFGCSIAPLVFATIEQKKYSSSIKVHKNTTHANLVIVMIMTRCIQANLNVQTNEIVTKQIICWALVFSESIIRLNIHFVQLSLALLLRGITPKPEKA